MMLSPVRKPVFPSGNLQLFVDIKMCIFAVGEATDLYFSLYSNTRKCFITEDHVLALTDAGMPINLKLLGKMYTLFKDLDAKDMDSDLYLVCRIYRQGRLKFDPSKKKAPSHFYRRPFGCAAFNVSSCGLDVSLGKEYQPPNSALTIYTSPSESSFAKLHERIIAKDSSLEAAPRAKGIALGLTLYANDYERLVKMDEKFNPADTPITNKIDFPEIMNPGDVRNDFYAFLVGGVFSQDNKKSAKNIEVTVRVCRSNGDTIENCIVRGSGEPPTTEYRSSVYYHCNNPSYEETMLLKIDPAVFSDCHLFMIFWHVSTSAKKSNPFAFAYLPLTTEAGAVIGDEEYKIPTFKPFNKMETISGAQESKAFYLQGNNAAPKLVPRKETFVVRTKLSSNKITQNSTLHSLFNYRRLSTEAIRSALKEFLNIRSGHGVLELSRFVRETFDVLFGMLTSAAHAPLHHELFTALLHILNLLTDKKLSQYRPLVDVYIQKVFQQATSHQILIDLCTERLNNALVSPDQNLVNLTKALSYVMKFIIASYHIQEEQGVSTQQTQAFHNGMLGLLKKLNAIVNLNDNTQSSSASSSLMPPSPSHSKHLSVSFSDHKEEKKDEKRGSVFMGGSVNSSSALNTARFIFPSQSYIIRGYPDYVRDLEGVFTASEVGHLVKELLLAIPPVANHNVNKLQLLRNLLPVVADNTESRHIVFPVMISIIQSHIRNFEASLTEPYLCLASLMPMLTVTQHKANFAPEKTWEYTALLPHLITLCLKVQQAHVGDAVLKAPPDTILQSCKVDMLLDSNTVLWSILQSLSDDQLDKFVDSLPLNSNGKEEEGDKARLISDLLTVCTNAVHLKFYPELWVLMTMTQLSLTERLLSRLARPIQSLLSSSSSSASSSSSGTSTSAKDMAHHAVFTKYFELCLLLLSCEGLALEKFSSKKRQFIESRYGDLRLKLTGHFRSMWNALRAAKAHFVSVLVAKLFDVVLNFEGDERVFALDIYFDMCIFDYSRSKDFALVERHTIDSLYNMANVSQEHGRRFMSIWSESIQARFDAHAEMKAAGNEYLRHIGKMYELMSSLLKFPDTALYEDERTLVAIKLMNYLESSGHVRKEMYARYVQYLVDLHVGLKNFVEAGVTQLLQINMHKWSDELVGAAGSYPEERERDRKERLYRSAISFFVQGEDYERAIERCEELRAYYEHQAFDYVKLASILTEQSGYYKKVLESERFYASYFRVVFHGQFDEELKEKEFVYRGSKLEPVMDFTNRIKRRYPEAKILMTSERPSDELYAQHAQLISITTLSRPSEQQRWDMTGCNGWTKDKKTTRSGLAQYELSIQEMKEKSGHKTAAGPMVPSLQALKSIPGPIAKYREFNNLKCFTYSRGLQKSTEKKPQNEFKHLWVVKTFIFTQESFPCIRRRCEVVDRKELTLSPIENAIQTMTSKNVELLDKIDSVEQSTSPNVDVGPLSMLLNGMIDAAVMGGTQKYIEAFLDDEWLAENQNETSLQRQEELKQTIRDMIVHLKRGLDVFGKRVDVKLKGLYDHQCAFYDQMVQKTKAVLQ